MSPVARPLRHLEECNMGTGIPVLPDGLEAEVVVEVASGKDLVIVVMVPIA
jgi:hypothetical protein